ncbi:MAG: hypothetical protein GTO12_10100 [Proteobacteria bacterium]|nr:hypothetical protein [Pseudomonadota bacterium]
MSPIKALFSGFDQVNRMTPMYIGEAEGKRVILVCSGVGKERSLKAADFIMARYSPEGALSAGFCGGLVPELRSSDVVLSSWVISSADESHGDSKKLFLRDQTVSLKKALSGKGIGSQIGGFITVRRPLISPGKRSTLAQRTGAMVAEMETFHLAEFFLDREIPFVGVRVVVDGSDDRLPLLGPFMERSGETRLLRALWHLVSDRSALLQLRRLYRNARRAQVTLAVTVPTVIAVWPEN